MHELQPILANEQKENDNPACNDIGSVRFERNLHSNYLLPLLSHMRHRDAHCSDLPIARAGPICAATTSTRKPKRRKGPTMSATTMCSMKPFPWEIQR